MFTIRAPIHNGGFKQATKPSDDYVINLNDIGPRDNIEERVGLRIKSINIEVDCGSFQVNSRFLVIRSN